MSIQSSLLDPYFNFDLRNLSQISVFRLMLFPFAYSIKNFFWLKKDINFTAKKFNFKNTINCVKNKIGVLLRVKNKIKTKNFRFTYLAIL